MFDPSPQGPYSQSCPSLPLPGDEAHDVESQQGTALSPIAIHVSVMTTRASDRESVSSFSSCKPDSSSAKETEAMLGEAGDDVSSKQVVLGIPVDDCSSLGHHNRSGEAIGR